MQEISFNRQIAEEAATWAVAFDEAPLSTEQRRELLRWLKTSPVHLDEFLLALSLFEGAGLSDVENMHSIERLLLEATADVVTFERIPGTMQRDRESAVAAGRAFPGRHSIAAAAVAVMFVLTAVGLQFFRGELDAAEIAPVSQIITTGLGEQRSIVLADGSIIYVNTQTRIGVRYSDDERRIDLESGEALFDVGRDARRPFRVYAGDSLTEAVGTKFNVRFIDNEAIVSVVEGTVAFERQKAGYDRSASALTPSGTVAGAELMNVDGRVLLSAGLRADLQAGAPTPVVSSTNVDAIAAWTGRRLIFDSTTLSSVAEEFNRYNRVKLIVSDPEIGSQRISGVFSSDDPQSLVSFLELTSDIHVIRTTEALRIVPNRER